MGWTRQQAIDYGVEASEVERYVVLPGQACAYMIGQLKIVELRERAREALGERFSIREFHDVVLRLVSSRSVSWSGRYAAPLPWPREQKANQISPGRGLLYLFA